MEDTLFLNFDPSDFIVLEDAVEFDETVQRDEKVRFYTIEEQEVDAYEKLIPKGRVTQFQRNEIKDQVHRIRELYEEYVVPTPETYTLREPVSGKVFNWVYPVYASPEFKAYDFKTSWMPLYDNMKAPMFYPRMISAMPHPFADVVEGSPYPIQKPTDFLNADGQKPRRALPSYFATKTVLHEDKTVDIEQYPIQGTSDTMNFVGYYLKKRPLDIPNPLLEHPFLKANEPTFIESTSALEDVLPSLDAILTHGVPNTNDPYTVAEPYLKLYDVQLRNIPWSIWKTKFPSVDVEQAVRERIAIQFPKVEQLAPTEKMLSVYKTQFQPVYSPREWLLHQIDGGEFVIKALQSAVIDNGSVQSIPGVDIPIPEYPKTTLEECSLQNLSFTDFNLKGILRRKNNSLLCVPLEFIKQERTKIGFLNRKPWKESSGNEMLEQHLRALHKSRKVQLEEKKETVVKTPAKNDSAKHLEVIAVYNDERRLPEDKVTDIKEIVKDLPLANNIYTDAEGLFVLCSHSLEWLSKKEDFYTTWTGVVDGMRVCKFCGERIAGSELVDQNEYTEDGFVIRRTQAIDETKPIFSPSESISSLQGVFDMSSPADNMCFLILSLLQVLPNVEIVTMYLSSARKVVKVLGTNEVAKGVVGLCSAILLLQAHVPALVPRRSFGNRPLKLNGYPRDLAEPEKYSILDTVIMVISNTFKAYPSTLTGPAKEVIRKILNAPQVIRATMVTLFKKLITSDVRKALDDAIQYRSGIPIVEEPKTLIPVPMPPSEFDIIQQYGNCPSLRPILASDIFPQIVQQVVPLRPGILAARTARKIIPILSIREEVIDIPKKEIQQRIGLVKGIEKVGISLEKSYHTNLLIASRIADMFENPLPVRTINPNQNQAELRDIAKGFVAEGITKVLKDPIKLSKLKEAKTKDIGLYTLLSDYKTEKASALNLRATERLKFVQEMAARSDLEREIIGELLKIGLAPYIITTKMREDIAKESEEKQNEEIGVGVPLDYIDQGDSIVLPDRGNYGDYTAQPSNDGRDFEQPNINEDSERSI